MSRRATRRILWLSFLLTVPVPFWAFEGGRVPTVWLLELAAFTGALLWTEGGTVTALAFGLFLGEAVIAGAALYLLARLVTRLLARRGAEVRTAVVVAIVVGFLLVACFAVYRTPFVAGGDPVNLAGIFQ
jgi:hypothetical protein